MKKVCVAFGAVVCIVGSVAAAPKLDKLKVQAAITGKHTKVFGVDNLFKAPNKETSEWYAVVDVVKQYVEQDGGNDELLKQALALSERASRDVVNTLKSTYNIVFASGKQPSEADIARSREDLNRLKAHVTELREMQGKLQGQRYYIGKQRADVRDILVVLLLTLETTIEKMGRDFDKQLKPQFTTLPVQRPRLALR